MSEATDSIGPQYYGRQSVCCGCMVFAVYSSKGSRYRRRLVPRTTD